jgi:hypothetical protein
MKTEKRNIKKIIKRNIDLKLNKKKKSITKNERNVLRTTPAKPIHVELTSHNNVKFELLQNIEKNENYESQTLIEKYYSIVIPTMWRSEKLIKMLSIYEKSKYVKEIIIIDNDMNAKPNELNLKSYSKVEHNIQEKNIYVNPAWNLGYSLSNYELILANDDIIINNFDEVIKLISNSNYDIVGLSILNENKRIELKTINTFPVMGFGYFMYIKNYVKIPNKLKIWYGDKILFDNNKKRGLIMNADIEYDKGKTLNSDNHKIRNSVAVRDIETYNSLFVSTIK